MRLPLCLMLLGVACGTSAQELAIYDDAPRNGFVDCYSSGGGTDLLHATTTRNGSLYSVAFTGNNANAVAFAHENVNFTTADYVGVRFYVHGGAAGGQQLRLQLFNNLGGSPLANVELDSYISGGAIAANEWRLVEARFANAPLSFAGTFDRVDLKSDVPGTQPTLYLDDVSLLAAAPSTPFIFSDSFEGSCPPGPAGNLRFTRAAFGVGEAGGSATIGVERFNGSFGPIAVTYATSDGTALQPGDYASANGMLSWAAGEVGTRNFPVAIVNDASIESDETINLALSGATGGATLVAPSSAVLTIADEDRSFSIGDVALNEGNTGTTAFTFTVTRGGNLSGTDTVQAQSADGTAAAPGDYAALAPTTLTFAPGATTQTVTVNVNGDTAFEPDETFFVNLSNPNGGTIADDQGLGTITNDDPLPEISIDDVMLSEGNAGPGAFTFTVTLSAASGGTVTVQAATADGTAVAPGDYAAHTSTVTFAPGVITQTVTVSVNGDTANETDETFFVNLSNPNGGTIADSQGLGTITNDDPLPEISIDDVMLSEGNAGPGAFTFTVTLSAASGGTVTVQAATADGTAVAPGDYAAHTSTVTFAPGVITQTVTVSVNGDTANETDETFFVNLSNPNGGTIADSQGLGTITNDDPPPLIRINDVVRAEGNAGPGAFTFTVTLSAASGRNVTVQAATANGTAVAPGDYAAQTSTVTFAPGVITQTVTVSVNGDTANETDETFFVNLSNPDGGTIDRGQGLGTITNDDPLPLISINDVALTEGSAGSKAFTFTVTLSVASGRNVTVQAATANGTAVAPGDYIATSATVTFPPGVITQTITVNVIGDTTPEPNETFFVNLSGATAAVIADAQGLGTIVNDD